MIDARQIIDNEIEDAYADFLRIPPQRVGWAHRELNAAGLPQQSRQNSDGSHNFRLTDANGAILERILNPREAGRTYGGQGTGRTPRSNMWLMITALAALVLGAGALFGPGATLALGVISIGVVTTMLIFSLSLRNDEKFLDSHGRDVGGNPK